MQDEGYLLWGDDGKPTQLNTLPEDILWHLSGRTWLAQTNLKEEADTSQVRWHSQDFTITRKGFTDHLVRKGDGASASIISAPLISEDGSLEFICPTKFPSFEIHGKEMFPLKELLLTIVTQVVLAKRMIKQLHGNSHHQSRTLVLQRERNMS